VYSGRIHAEYSVPSYQILMSSALFSRAPIDCATRVVGAAIEGKIKVLNSFAGVPRAPYAIFVDEYPISTARMLVMVLCRVC